MPAIAGNIVAILLVFALTALSVKELIAEHKNGGCAGCASGCGSNAGGGCHCCCSCAGCSGCRPDRNSD